MEPKFDYQKLQKSIQKSQRRKFLLLISVVVAIVLVVVLAVPRVLNAFYYDPRSGNELVEGHSYISNRQINNELTVPNRYLTNFQITKTGIGSYEISELYQNYAQESQGTKNYQITRNRIATTGLAEDRNSAQFYFESRMRDADLWSSGNQAILKTNLLQNIQDLPESTQLTVMVLFENDMTLEEYKEWHTYQAPQAETLWTAVRTKVPNENEHRLPVGFAGPYSSIGMTAKVELDQDFLEKYPLLTGFSATDEQNKLSAPERDGLHFTSLLKFLKTQKEFLGLEPGMEHVRTILSEKQIDETLAYVEKNGVNTYGVMLRLSLPELKKLLEQNENLLEVRVFETQLFDFMGQSGQYHDKEYETTR